MTTNTGVGVQVYIRGPSQLFTSSTTTNSQRTLLWTKRKEYTRETRRGVGRGRETKLKEKTKMKDEK